MTALLSVDAAVQAISDITIMQYANIKYIKTTYLKHIFNTLQISIKLSKTCWFQYNTFSGKKIEIFDNFSKNILVGIH